MRASKEELIQRGVLRAQDFSPPLGTTSHDVNSVNKLGNLSVATANQSILLGVHFLQSRSNMLHTKYPITIEF